MTKKQVWFNDALAAVADLLVYIGEDPSRDGLKDTPFRVVGAMHEMYGGYRVDVGKLFRTFECDCDEMVVVKGIPFASMCEHHMLPFTGVAHVGYVPKGGKVVGLSKIARVVDAYAKRLQMQERMTLEVADAFWTYLQPAGVGVVVEATHHCMSCRGVGKPGATMVTSRLLGVFRDGPARAEFLSLIGGRP